MRLPFAAARPSSVLDLYLGEIQNDDLLTAAEESALAAAIARGDSGARARMIQSNLRLVVRIARDYLGRGLALDDLIGEGNLGLIRAAEEFDPAFGTRFSTYASYWIKQAIRHALTNTTATIRLPAHMVNLLTKWRRAERALARELDQAPTEEQIAVALGLTDAQLDLVRKAKLAGRLQLESGFTDETHLWSPDESADERHDPSAALEAEDDRRLLQRRLDRLEPRERMVVVLRYGLEGNAPLTLKEVGRRLGVTREWVRKIEIRAVRKLDDDSDSDSNDETQAQKPALATPARRRKAGPRPPFHGSASVQRSA
jgi:RNA polymerase primary sigma factor